MQTCDRTSSYRGKSLETYSHRCQGLGKVQNEVTDLDVPQAKRHIIRNGGHHAGLVRRRLKSAHRIPVHTEMGKKDTRYSAKTVRAFDDSQEKRSSES